MHEHLRPLADIGPLHNPVLIAAITGWTDATGAAVAALDYLVEQWGATPVAEVNPEPFYDFTVQRPRTLLDGDQRRIEWPENRFYVARPAGADRDFLLFAGIEPHLRWRMYTELVEDMMQTVGASTSVTLGVQPGPVPHTRPLPVNLSASDNGFEEQFGLKIPTSRYEGPAGIISVLNLHFRSLDWRNASLWAVVPHYLNVGPNPNAAVSLVKAVDRGFGTSTSQVGLEARCDEFTGQVREALEQSDDAASYIVSLEEQYDSNTPGAVEVEEMGGELPTSDELLGDLENFLRQQREDR